MVAFLCSAILGQGSMFAKIVPNPTGVNGYEEYVRAADVAATPDFDAYDGWLSVLRSGNATVYADRPFGVDPQDPDLTVKRKWVDRYRTCCDLVSNGNRKPVSDPRGPYGPDTLFPEFHAFRSLAKLEAVTAHVAFADGQSGDGVRHLEDGLVFANKIGCSTLIGRLVGIACNAMSYVELDDHWAQLSLSDAQELETFFAHGLTGPPTLLATIRGEREAAHAAVDQMFAKPADFAGAWVTDRNERRSINSISKMGPVDSRATEDATIAAVDAYYDSMVATLDGPESEWLAVKEADSGDQAQDAKLPLATRLANLIEPTMSRVLVKEAEDRTRMRLALLTAKAVEFRWVKGHLPDRIEDFTTAQERLDATSGKAFRYRRDGPWFRITREGRDSLGGVSLFKPPPQFDPNGGLLRP